MDKAQKPINLECYTSSPEAFILYLLSETSECNYNYDYVFLQSL
jgi:hypothetical protein